MSFTGVCIICNEPVKPKLARSKVAKTCSRKCMGIMLTGENNPNYGNKYSDETRKKLSEKTKSDWKNPEYRKKVRKARINSELVKEHCRKISKLRALSEEAKLKERQTNESNGRWISLDQKTEYQLYCRKVWIYTRKYIDVSKIEGYEYRGKAGIDNSYHLDHKFSLLECFKQGVPIEIAGSLVNLEFIPWLKNQKKSGKCSITKEELYAAYDRFTKGR